MTFEDAEFDASLTPEYAPMQGTRVELDPEDCEESIEGTLGESMDIAWDFELTEQFAGTAVLWSQDEETGEMAKAEDITFAWTVSRDNDVVITGTQREEEIDLTVEIEFKGKAERGTESINLNGTFQITGRVGDGEWFRVAGSWEASHPYGAEEPEPEPEG
jgi:hypothetical protein